MICPDENAVVAFFDLALPQSEASRVEAHVATCAACRHLLGNLGAMAAASHDTSSEVTGPMSPVDGRTFVAGGTAVGRFLVLGPLGAGSMGVVLAAYDPELDRKVALKLLSAHDGQLEHQDLLQARLAREAQAIAQVSHPNVVSIYEVGRFQDRVFLAMEFVAGTTLTEWVSARPRPWQEILAMFVEAGHGVAATHAAGLVHRDFKPDNVLVTHAGHAKVVDFGLARSIAAPRAAPASTRPTGAAASPVLTHAGALVGTPAYMAPEQRAGQPASAAADQFSFCVALYEALYGERPGPIDGGRPGPVDPPQQRDRALAARVADPRVPAWLLRAILKGLQPQPEDRHASMSALLQVLRSQPRQVRRRRWMAVGALAAAVLAGVSGASLRARAQNRATMCAGAEARLAGVWDEPRRLAIEGAFGRSGRATAAQASQRVTAILDGYASDWARAQTEACTATRIRGEQPEAVMGERTQCLDRRLAEAGALVEILARADEGGGRAIDQAVRAAEGLEPPAACNARAHPVASTQGRQPIVDAATRQALARAAMLTSVASYAEASRVAQPMLDAARAANDPILEAEALSQLGRIALATREAERAEPLLFDALALGQRFGQDELVARAGMDLALVVGFQEERTDEAEKWLRLATVSIDKLGGDDRLRADVAGYRGSILRRAGRYRESIEEYRRQLQLVQEKLPLDTRRMAISLGCLGAGLETVGENAEAQTNLEQALALEEQDLGPSSPRVGIQLTALGMLAINRARYDEGRAYLERALAVPETPGASLVQQHTTLGWAFALLGRYAEAHRELGLAHGLLSDKATTDKRAYATLYWTAGYLERLEKDYDASERDYARSFAYYLESAGGLGRDNPETANASIGLGRVYLERGDAARALAPLERTLALLEKSLTPEADRAEARLALAQALLQTGRDRPRGRALLEQARDFYRRDPSRQGEVREMTAWFEANRL